ncbi:hypothetical protein BU25DRAFT_415220 [Macroventuria anomochaeta]|uniref:Uncharacterized protein n=1 Tax=Macroventuria anomochaeta TaxID=301207 RepID=A0ACB6RN07_9PLEO|nr:uncharacterized protein BU25DRAFT_415220 [Macroventuria anomochaeta]KAF2622493.1 hypothetical protein BU25DRAFT_415220 [Macroventuria anomochaeta]
MEGITTYTSDLLKPGSTRTHNPSPLPLCSPSPNLPHDSHTQTINNYSLPKSFYASILEQWAGAAATAATTTAAPATRRRRARTSSKDRGARMACVSSVHCLLRILHQQKLNGSRYVGRGRKRAEDVQSCRLSAHMLRSDQPGKQMYSFQ